MPLVGVAAILLLTFATLALAAPAPSGPQTLAQVDAPPAHAIETLPASGEDADMVQSDLDPQDAQARNAAVAIVEQGPGTAEPFRFAGSGADRAR